MKEIKNIRDLNEMTWALKSAYKAGKPFRVIIGEQNLKLDFKVNSHLDEIDNLDELVTVLKTVFPKAFH